MKKILSMMLALLCIFSLVACGGNGGTTPPTGDQTSEDLDVFEAAAKGDSPTNITTLTSYKRKADGEEISFDGSFVLLVNGNDSTLDYTYERFPLLSEQVSADQMTKQGGVVISGAIGIQGGKSKQIGGAVSAWATVIPSMQENIAALRIQKDLLPADYTLSEDGKKLSVSLTKEEALKSLGVVIDASEIAFEAETNGTFLSKVVISYVAESGASVRIATSYTYGPQTLNFARFN